MYILCICNFRHSFAWNAEKNEALKRERGVAFEDVLNAIEGGLVLEVEPHPNQTRYRGQLRMIVLIRGYAHIVPFVVDDERGHVFLKTIIQGRKKNKDALSNNENHV